MGTALRPILHVVKLEAVLASSPTQLTLVVVAIEYGEAGTLRNVLRVFPLTVLLEISSTYGKHGALDASWRS
jgi:hypothetical protein